MHRVLSFQMGMSGRGFGESSEFVTKRMCFSFIFFFGFLALIGGFLLGRMSTEKTLKLCEDRNIKCVEFTSGVLEAPGPSQIPYNLLLEELQHTSVDQFHSTENSEKYRNEDDHTDPEAVKTILSNSNLIYNIVQRKSSVAATLIGSIERDRWVVLSVSGEGTSLALELLRIFGNLSTNHNWKPQRTIIFCFSDVSNDSCRDVLPKYSKSRIVAYLAVHGNAVHKRGCLSVTGSDIIKSVVLGTVRESISAPDSNGGQIFDSCKIEDDLKNQTLVPRLFIDVPHASISIIISNGTRTELSNKGEGMLPYGRILVRIIGLSVWKLSESAVLQWDPKDFERSVKTALKMISSPQFGEVQEKIALATEKLVNQVQGLSIGSIDTRNLSSLSTRMTNDLLTDLDRALLCPDIDFRSKTDLVIIPELLRKSQEEISSFLEGLLKCYNDAVEVIQEG